MHINSSKVVPGTTGGMYYEFATGVQHLPTIDRAARSGMLKKRCILLGLWTLVFAASK